MKNETTERIDVQDFFNNGPLEIADIETTFPLLNHIYRKLPDSVCSVLFDNANNSNQIPSLKLKLNHQLDSIDPSTYPNAECVKSYLPAFKRYQGTVRNCSTNQFVKSSIFFKLTGTLEPNTLVSGKYSDDASCRSTKHNFVQNTAYVDSLASFLTSQLVEKRICPHFPKVYGIYQGRAKRHYVEFTEEYYDHRRHTQFREGIKNNKWRMVPQPGGYNSDSDESDGSEGSDGNIEDNLMSLLIDNMKNNSSDMDSPDSPDSKEVQQLINTYSRLQQEGGDSSNATNMFTNVIQSLQESVVNDEYVSDDNHSSDEDDSRSHTSLQSNDSMYSPDLDTCVSINLNEIETIPVETSTLEFDNDLSNDLSNDSLNTQSVSTDNQCMQDSKSDLLVTWTL